MTWGYTTPDLLNFTPLSSIVLAKGTDGNFDGCSGGGAWLNSTWTDPSNPSFVRGWYHAESGCDPAGNRKSIGYAESYDGGLTFTKPDYPNNQVITAPARFTDPAQGEGDQHVIRVGNYFYMYFVACWDTFRIHLARSLVTDGGRPGTWWKYYNGSFSQPGLGGESTAIASGSVLGRAWVSYNTALNAYMGFSWSSQGFGISMSPDGISNWRQVSGTLLWTDHTFWGRGPGSGELIEYMSLVGLDGNVDQQGSDLWLYYMSIPAGQPASGDTRYLVRQALNVSMPGGFTPTVAPTITATPTLTTIPTDTPMATA
jgi:hypothetical protein